MGGARAMAIMDTLSTVNSMQLALSLELDTSLRAISSDTIVQVPEGEIDPRLKRLSYSSIGTLHSCPRKYQLYKLNAQRADEESRINFAFGHAVGEGIQATLEGVTEQATLFRLFLAWDADLFEEDTRAKKSIWYAVQAVQKFSEASTYAMLKEYELAEFPITNLDGKQVLKPAVELSFRVHFPDGFSYIGFVDAVLRHKQTGKLLVLELKTTRYKEVNPAMYKNSSQALGYAVVLDTLAPGNTSYEVLYCVYKSLSQELEFLPFTKTVSQKALWIRQLLLDIDLIQRYEDAGIYPMYGESCMNFNRQCEYFANCTLTTKAHLQPLTERMLQEAAKETYDTEVPLEQVIETLLALTQ